MTLYEKIIQAPDTIGWRDILSDARKKHEKKDTEYALITGTSLDSANPQNMLQKWQKPWLFYRMTLAGVVLMALMYGLQYLLKLLFGGEVGYGSIIAFIVPMIFPLILMVFFWEMNIPRNISVIELLGIFLCGAAFCFFVTFVLFLVVSDPVVSFERFGAGTTELLAENGLVLSLSSTAALREEPAKLAASVAILVFLAKKSKKQIYGFTGLVVGAAVGAAFSAYESVQYGIHYGTEVVLLRAVLAIGGHVLFCAPYTAVLALHMKNNTLTPDSFLNKEFGIAFGFSVLMHMLWNFGTAEYIFYLSIAPWKSGVFQELYQCIVGIQDTAPVLDTLNVIDLLTYPKCIAIIAALWCYTLVVVRSCCRQIGGQQAVSQNPGSTPGFQIQGLRGYYAGKAFSIKSSEVFIGCDSSCGLCYPMGTNNLEGKHSKLLIRNGALYLGDLGSAAGTYLNGTRLPPKQGHLLQRGDEFWIGSDQEAFRVI